MGIGFLYERMFIGPLEYVECIE